MCLIEDAKNESQNLEDCNMPCHRLKNRILKILFLKAVIVTLGPIEGGNYLNP